MTKTECSVIRAYAILSIFLHNYIHWLPNTPQENEFEFDVNRHWNFIHSINIRKRHFYQSIFISWPFRGSCFRFLNTRKSDILPTASSRPTVSVSPSMASLGLITYCGNPGLTGLSAVSLP